MGNNIGNFLGFEILFHFTSNYPISNDKKTYLEKEKIKVLKRVDIQYISGEILCVN
jgi:hypothetical protein